MASGCEAHPGCLPATNLRNFTAIDGYFKFCASVEGVFRPINMQDGCAGCW